jgi:hypothetical protein
MSLEKVPLDGCNSCLRSHRSAPRIELDAVLAAVAIGRDELKRGTSANTRIDNTEGFTTLQKPPQPAGFFGGERIMAQLQPASISHGWDAPFALSCCDGCRE